MTFFIKIENGSPVGNAIIQENLQQLFPNTSFPRFVLPGDIEPMGYGIYDFASQPEVGRYQKVVEIAPVRDATGIWRQTWAVVQKNDAEKAEEDEERKRAVRFSRDELLSRSDWTQVLDAPITNREAWTQYRQALRDVTEQAGFPFDVQWPEEPTE